MNDGLDKPLIPLDTDLGPCRVVSVPERGAFGEVYRVRRSKGRPRFAALKVLHPKGGGLTPALLEKFALESELVGKRPAGRHMPRRFETGTWEGAPWYVMTLGERIRKTLTLDEVVPLIHDIATACQLLFEAHYLHGDIKPSNILTLGGRGLLADFGSALPFDPTDRLGHVRGTPYFMAPEVERDHVMTILSEVYSIGRTLKCLCDRDAARVLADVINRATDESPERRQQSMREFADEVRETHRAHKAAQLHQQKHYRFKTILRWTAGVTSAVLIISALIFAIRIIFVSVRIQNEENDDADMRAALANIKRGNLTNAVTLLEAIRDRKGPRSKHAYIMITNLENQITAPRRRP